MEVRCSPESFLRPDRGPIGLSAPASASTFRSYPAVSLLPPFTTSLRLQRSSSRELFASSRVRRPATCPPRPEQSRDCPEAEERLPWGSVPLRDINQQRPLELRGSQAPVVVPPSAFRTPSTVCSATSLAGLFRPAATSRVCPTGICPSPRSRTGFRRPIHALVPLSEPACGVTRAGKPALDFRALLPAVSAVSSEAV
jgi:hypothetical protein